LVGSGVDLAAVVGIFCSNGLFVTGGALIVTRLALGSFSNSFLDRFGVDSVVSSLSSFFSSIDPVPVFGAQFGFEFSKSTTSLDFSKEPGCLNLLVPLERPVRLILQIKEMPKSMTAFLEASSGGRTSEFHVQFS
jgi:hypothetical protein